MSAELKAAETAGAVPVSTTGVAPVPALVTPTQIRKPWRSTARTAFQGFVAFLVLFPILVEAADVPPRVAAYLAIPVAVSTALARVMALPQVEVFLRRYLPFLSASGRQ